MRGLVSKEIIKTFIVIAFVVFLIKNKKYRQNKDFPLSMVGAMTSAYILGGQQLGGQRDAILSAATGRCLLRRATVLNG